jgi:hypothetical protein
MSGSGDAENKGEPRLRLIGEDGQEIVLVSELEAEHRLAQLQESKELQDRARRRRREAARRKERNDAVRAGLRNKPRR